MLSSAYTPMAEPEPPPALDLQLEEIMSSIRRQELRWRRQDRIRRSSRRRLRRA